MHEPYSLPLADTARLLIEGGDGRITPDKISGVNRYGCRATPYPELLSFASATATVISTHAYAAADTLRTHLQQALASSAAETVYKRELQRMRNELLALCTRQDLPEPEVIFAASGTDLHHIAAQLGHAADAPGLTVLMVDQSETGSGVFASISYADPSIKIATIALRHSDGAARTPKQIDAEFSLLANQAQRQGRQILLIQTDVSKTGMIAPSYACTASLSQQFGGGIDVLIDACQFRISPLTLHACLARGYNVALTGSKFVGGPSFSGALLIPQQSMARIRQRYANATPLRHNTHVSDIWQAHYVDSSSWGMILRWEAAFCELRAFRNVPTVDVSNFMHRFSVAIQNRLHDDPSFTPIGIPTLQRNGLRDLPDWDDIPSIFPFKVRGSAMQLLNETQLAQLYRQLPYSPTPCQLAQPVGCGNTKDALRICLSAHQIVAGCQSSAHAEQLIAQAYLVLDQVALLASKLHHEVDTVTQLEQSIESGYTTIRT